MIYTRVLFLIVILTTRLRRWIRYPSLPLVSCELSLVHFIFNCNFNHSSTTLGEDGWDIFFFFLFVSIGIKIRKTHLAESKGTGLARQASIGHLPARATTSGILFGVLAARPFWKCCHRRTRTVSDKFRTRLLIVVSFSFFPSYFPVRLDSSL